MLQIIIIYTRVNKKKIKNSGKEYVIRTCLIWPMKNIFGKLSANESFIMTCVQIYQELLLFLTFLQVHSSSKEVSYLSWQNRYPNLKINYCTKLKFSLWTKLLENLLLAKYFIYVAAALNNIELKSKESVVIYF